MNKETRRIEIEICGDETIRHLRRLCIEVPIEMSDEDIEMMDASVFAEAAETTEWEIEESDGIFPDGNPCVIGPAKADAEVELTLDFDDLRRIQANLTK